MPAQATASPLILELNPPPGTRVRVISDLHLGHERCEVPSLQQLAPLLSGVDILVVAGDLAETRAGAWQQRGLALRADMQALCRAHGVELITLAGNHDPDGGPQLLRLWNGKAAILHGHALYKEGSPWGWEYLLNTAQFKRCIAGFPHCDSSLEERLQLASSICQLIPPIMQHGGRRLNRHLEGLLHCFFPPKRPLFIVWGWLTCGWRAEAFARRFFPEAEVMVFGHLHRSGSWRFGKRRIVNTGGWYKHATPWLADLQDGQLVAYRKAL